MTHDFKADLDVSISFLKHILPYELGGDVAKHLDILFKAALKRNDVPHCWSDDITHAPRNERILMVIDGYVQIAKFEHYSRMWVVFRCDDSWYQEEYHETYPTEWMPLPEAPKGGE